MTQTFTYLEVEAALCVWECLNEWTLLAGGDVHEAAINDESLRTDWIELREGVGSAEMRHQSVVLGQWCLKIYDICTKHDPDFFDFLAYDWEVIPMILDYAEARIYEADLPAPERIAPFVAYQVLFDNFVRDCRQEANQLWAYADLVSDHEDRFLSAFTAGEDPHSFTLWLGEKYDLTRADRW